MTTHQSLMGILFATAAIACAGNALAVGTGTVAAGSATITHPTGVKTLITQTSGKAVIDWTNFNSAAGETVQFVQPSTGAIALNRISGGPTSFSGTLTANGKVWLINPEGMLFGNATVNTGSLLLSTAGISNATGSGFFTNGTTHYAFDEAGSPTASITIDHTVITAKGTPSKGGDILIQAPAVSVKNFSKLQTAGGTVSLQGGETFTADFNGDGLINFQVIVDPVSTIVPGHTSTVEVRTDSSINAGLGHANINAKILEDAVLDHVINLGGQFETGTYDSTTNPEHVSIKPAINTSVAETIIPNPPPPVVNKAAFLTSSTDADINTHPLTRKFASLSVESVGDGTVNPNVANLSYERPYLVSLQTSLAEGSLTLLAPSAGNAGINIHSPGGLGNLSPSAGGDNPGALGELSPSAGGGGVSCANSYLDTMWMNKDALHDCVN